MPNSEIRLSAALLAKSCYPFTDDLTCPISSVWIVVDVVHFHVVLAGSRKVQIRPRQFLRIKTVVCRLLPHPLEMVHDHLNENDATWKIALYLIQLESMTEVKWSIVLCDRIIFLHGRSYRACLRWSSPSTPVALRS